MYEARSEVSLRETKEKIKRDRWRWHASEGRGYCGGQTEVRGCGIGKGGGECENLGLAARKTRYEGERDRDIRGGVRDVET